MRVQKMTKKIKKLFQFLIKYIKVEWSSVSACFSLFLASFLSFKFGNNPLLPAFKVIKSAKKHF